MRNKRPATVPDAINPSPHRIIAYTEGACREDSGIGSWGIFLVDTADEVAMERWGGATETTLRRMELTALVEALDALRTVPLSIEIRTESKWLYKLGTGKLSAWKSQGWHKRNNNTVPDMDLVRRLAKLLEAHHVYWHRIKGARAEPGNELVGNLLSTAIQSIEAGEADKGEQRHERSPLRLRRRIKGQPRVVPTE